MSKVALITGGSSGIGLATARALGKLDYKVTISARRPDKLEASAKQLQSEGVDLHHFAANVANEEEIAALVESHRQKFGGLDLLMNNAGVGIGGALEGYDVKYLDMQLAVNLRSVFLLTSQCIPMLKEAAAKNGTAQIVNLASIAGKEGQAWISAYSATKAGVVGLTQATQHELGPDGIKATALCPAFVDTPMTEYIQDQIPADRMITTEDVASTVVWLTKLSPNCVIPEVVMKRPGESM